MCKFGQWRRQIGWRILSGSVCIVLLAWLASQGSTAQRRRAAIDQALRQGQIGQLSQDQTAWLSGTIAWMASAAGVGEPIVLNAPFHKGRLQVYTTTPTVLALTHCGRGNAVYDAQLDVIFLDRDLFDSRDFRTYLSTTAYGNLVSLNDLPFVQTYVRFLILHELGHRTLHRKAAASFDSGGSAAEIREREADAFALEHLQTAYSMPQARSSNVGEGGAELLNLQYERLNTEERTLVDLLDMTVGMNLSLLFRIRTPPSTTIPLMRLS
jgi:hypothetical protein